MGQKVHPYGFRLGYTKPWKSRWFVERDYDKLLLEDVKLKAELKDKLKSAGISAPRAKCSSISKKCTSRNWMRSWYRNRLRCSWRSAWVSGGPCASRWIRRCASAARESRCASAGA